MGGSALQDQEEDQEGEEGAFVQDLPCTFVAIHNDFFRHSWRMLGRLKKGIPCRWPSLCPCLKTCHEEPAVSSSGSARRLTLERFKQIEPLGLNLGWFKYLPCTRSLTGSCISLCGHLPVSRVVMYSISLLGCFACMYRACRSATYWIKRRLESYRSYRSLKSATSPIL